MAHRLLQTFFRIARQDRHRRCQMRMTHMVLAAALFAGVSTIAITAQDKDSKEQKVTLEQLPAAVQAAVKEQTKGATVKGFAIETENGKKLYEAELTVNGHAKDISFDAGGAIVSVEEETTLDKIPAPARAALEKAAGQGKIVIVEGGAGGRRPPSGVTT